MIPKYTLYKRYRKIKKYNYSQLKLPLGYSVNNYSFITCIKSSSGLIMAEFHSL